MIDLINKIPKSLKLLTAGVGTLAILSSCAEMGLSQAESMVGLGNIMLMDDDPSNDDAARLMISTYSLKHQREVAAAGRSNTNINIGRSNADAGYGNYSTNCKSAFPNGLVWSNDGSPYPAPGFKWLNSVSGDWRVIQVLQLNEKGLPEGVIYRNGYPYPAPGYNWVNSTYGDWRTVEK